MKQSAISVIGGADGPTSVFMVSRKLSFKNKVKRFRYRCKRRIVSARITPSNHTLEEVKYFIRNQYGATEISKQGAEYIEERTRLKESLVLSKRPELLGDLKDVSRPVEYNEDEIRKMQLQIESRRKLIADISEDLIPMDFHIFEISHDEGNMKVVIDFKWDILSCSYSGSKKEMKRLKKIAREIYLYYGVTKEDIQNKSERFTFLVTMLST